MLSLSKNPANSTRRAQREKRCNQSRILAKLCLGQKDASSAQQIPERRTEATMSKKSVMQRLRKHASRVARRVLPILAVLLGLGVALVFSLPALFSSNFARTRVAEELTKATGKPAHISALSFGWSDGLRVSGLVIGQGTLSDPHFLASLDTLHADFSLLAALRGDVRLSLTLRGLRLRVPLKSEPAPPVKPLSEVLHTLFATLRAGSKPIFVKFDAHVQVDLADMTVRLEPEHDGKAVELRDMNVRFETSGLKSAPMTLALNVTVAPEQERMEPQQAFPVHFKASVTGLVDARGHIAPAQAVLAAKAEAPGVVLNASGSLAKTLNIDLHAQLREALASARPLFAKPLPDANGALALGLTLSQLSADKWNVSLQLFADALRATGFGADEGKEGGKDEKQGGKSIGPLSFSLLQEAELDLAAQTVRLPGSLKIKPATQACWLAELTGVATGKPRLSLSIKPLHLDFSGLLPALRGLLPPGVSLGAATLDAANIEAAMDLPAPGLTPQVETRLSGLNIAAQNISRRDASGAAHIDHLSLRMETASMSLPGSRTGKNVGAPARATAGATTGMIQARIDASADGVRQMSARANAKSSTKDNVQTSVNVRKINMPRADLHVDGFALNAAALFGITGKADLELEVQAKDVQARGKAQIPDLSATVRLHADLPTVKSANLNMESFNLAAPVVRVQPPGPKSMATQLALHASAPDIRLVRAAKAVSISSTGPAIVPTIRAMRVDLDLGPALRCNATMSLTGANGRDLSTAGRVSLDAAKLMGLAAPFVSRQAKASGTLAVDWKLAAMLPPAHPTGPDKAAKTLAQTIKDLGFVSEAEAVLNLDDISLDWELAPKPGGTPSVLHLRGLFTPRPLRLSTKGGTRESSLTGSLAFGPMNALPGIGRLDKPLHGLITINAAQQGARSVQLSEVLHLDGFELDQNFSLNLDKLDKVLDHDADRLATVLELADGQASFNLTSGDVASAMAAKHNGKGLTSKGRLEVGAEAQLSGSRSLAFSARLLSPGLDLALGPDTAIIGLTSDVRLSRRYRLAPGLRCPVTEGMERTPLSEQVFALFPAKQSAPAASEALGQLLRAETQKATGGTFSLTRLKLKSGGLPLDIRDVELRLDDSGPVPGLRYFRAGLLGGNVLGSAMIRKSGGGYNVIADMAFTGINPGRLFPAKGQKELASQTEASGRVRLEAPLTPDPQALLQQLNFRADFTKIGPRTLQRLLYALDPEEQNETIVQQRRLMAIGYPRFLRVAASYGNLSVSGAVDVKGFQLDLPQLDRLSIADLPLRKQLAKPLASVPALIKALDAASGSSICRDSAKAKGATRALRVVESAATQGAPQ
jgi:translocation and assembly module TamB